MKTSGKTIAVTDRVVTAHATVRRRTPRLIPASIEASAGMPGPLRIAGEALLADLHVRVLLGALLEREYGR
jgi:hypothetical protein